MSVVIKDMDLSKSCSDCPFCMWKYASDEDDDGGAECIAMVRRWDDERLVDHYENEDGDFIDFDIKSGRHPDCPMSEKEETV